jgi:hypothetical protein
MARVHPDDRAHLLDSMAGVAPGKPPIEFEHRAIRPDGSERVLFSHAETYLDASGRHKRIIGITQDITERRKAKEELRRRAVALEEANERLQELDRLKNAFVSTVSHELRTPLTSIRGYAEFLEDGVAGPLSAGQAGFVAQIMAGARRLETLVDDLLDFARLESGTFRLNREPLDLGAKVSEVIASFGPQAREKQLSLVARLPEAPLTLQADPGRIGQVLINLIGNALKFTPQGGRVTVSLGAEGDQARVGVRNTGPAIPAEHQGRLFERFYQVDSSNTRRAGGTGLGLSISKALVEAHGGRIGLASAPEEGTTFWFSLPLAATPGNTCAV